MAGQNVQVDRHGHFLSRGPEFVIVAGVEGQVRMGCLPDDGALQPRFLASFQFFYRLVNVVHGDGTDADQALRSHLAVLDQPVVVAVKTGFLQLRIIKPEKAQQMRRVKHLCTDAIGLHLLEPVMGILAARM